MEALQNYRWWEYLDGSQRDGLVSSFSLLKREEINRTQGVSEFSFIVFPAAKAYEGFLKKFLFDLGFISKFQYEGDRFRIGRALNPNLEENFRHESVYDKLKEYCGGESLPDKLWKTWKNCRNLLFHWWPGDDNAITLEEAGRRIWEMVGAIAAAFIECKGEK